MKSAELVKEFFGDVRPVETCELMALAKHKYPDPRNNGAEISAMADLVRDVAAQRNLRAAQSPDGKSIIYVPAAA